MKHLITVCIIVLWAYAYPCLSRLLDDSSVVKAHQEWMIKYGITYTNSFEMEKRLQIFKENLEKIQKFNNEGNNSYTLGLNPFSDLTDEEFDSSYTGCEPSNISSSEIRSNTVIFNLTDDDFPTNLDWREKGAVTDVKNQKRCAACWAFAAVAVVESIWQIKKGHLYTLAEQQLVDCDLGNHGCSGGSFARALRHIIDSDGVVNEDQYPYQGQRNPQGCQLNQHSEPDVYISSYTFVQPNDERQLLRAVAEQPVSINLATSDGFRHYTGGIYKGPCGTRNSHAVTIVGFGEENGEKYWLIKNSWSKNWGENGYMKIIRQAGGPEGHCGLAKHPVYPVI